nr:hypothetical protein Iba_scaffold11830CG0010 [Ipomoea batatas]GME19872.1 hypothetical protein Iba_scaffold24013CG0050 [Ipomoea batatas]
MPQLCSAGKKNAEVHHPRAGRNLGEEGEKTSPWSPATTSSPETEKVRGAGSCAATARGRNDSGVLRRSSSQLLSWSIAGHDPSSTLLQCRRRGTPSCHPASHNRKLSYVATCREGSYWPEVLTPPAGPPSSPRERKGVVTGGHPCTLLPASASTLEGEDNARGMRKSPVAASTCREGEKTLRWRGPCYAATVDRWQKPWL